MSSRPSSYPTQPSSRGRSFSGLLLAGLLVLFLAAFAYASYLFFQTARLIILNAPQVVSARSSDTAPSNASTTGADGQTLVNSLPVGSQNQPAQSPITPLLGSSWNEQEPINILLLGIDQRPGEKGYYRTDTMIVVHIDPNTGQIGMLSLPRDLWVQIPGFYETRINMAHYLGDANDTPGGGPVLAKETVSQFLGQPIHYYVRINFLGFRALMAEIGCIEIDVPKDINDPTFPDDNYGYDPFTIQAGHYCMEADTALKYARTRHVDSDFGRMQRQQQVLLAIKNKILESGGLTQMIARIPTLLEILTDSMQTDMPLSQQITLANLARKLNTSDIRQLIIDDTMTERTILPSGADVLMPKLDVIQPAVAKFFTPPLATPSSPADPVQEQLATEQASIAVLNGTDRPQLAEQVATKLIEQGYHVVGYAPADRSDYAQTQIIDYSGKQFTLQHLANLLAIADENIRSGATGGQQVDIQLILGADFQF
ncbi:MAG: LCP family protein [Chloroflexi bacterium]|nr:LCP family protein [Chloroflexota bacterium]